MSRKPREHVWYQYFYVQTVGLCPICQINVMRKCDSKTWHVEHILKLSLGGPDTYPNLIPICVTCNLAMGKSCATSFDYMLKIGALSEEQAVLAKARHIECCKNFDPVCEKIQKNGKRCSNLRGGKAEKFCWKHINLGLEPMDCSPND